MVKKLLAKINIIYWVSGAYVMFSLILGISIFNTLVIFLGWNMILATFAYFLSEIFTHLYKKKTKKIVLLISFGIWLIFFPNTFYLLTDLIHFQNYDFFKDYPNIYAFEINQWLIFFHLVVGAFLGVKLGIMSIFKIEHSVHMKSHIKWICMIAICYLSSIAIYIGRFIRLNSWNILKIPSVFYEIKEEFIFFTSFTIMFTTLHMLIYLLFHPKLNIKWRLQ